MGELKTVLIFDSRGKRAPNVWSMYNYLRHEFNIAYVDDLDVPAVNAINFVRPYMGGEIAGIVWGFKPGTALEQSKEYLNEKGIPIIISVGDVWQFLERPFMSKQFWGLKHIKGLLYKQRLDNPDDDHLRRLRELIRTGFKPVGKTKEEYGTDPETFLNNAKVLFSPWALDHTKVAEPDHDIKTTDVAHICTITPANGIHDTRQKHRGIVENLKKSVGTYTENVYRKRTDICPDCGGILEALVDDKGQPKEEGYCEECKKIFKYDEMDDYDDILHRTKILVVDASGSGLTTQKYIEGAIHGCLLIGERPYLDSEVFDHNSMVECSPTELEQKIYYYLDNEQERRYIADELRSRVIKHYTLDHAIGPIVEMLK